MAIIISADDLKETISGYDPSKSHLVHTESARMADALYAKNVKRIGRQRSYSAFWGSCFWQDRIYA